MCTLHVQNCMTTGCIWISVMQFLHSSHLLTLWICNLFCCINRVAWCSNIFSKWEIIKGPVSTGRFSIIFRINIYLPWIRLDLWVQNVKMRKVYTVFRVLDWNIFFLWRKIRQTNLKLYYWKIYTFRKI